MRCSIKLPVPFLAGKSKPVGQHFFQCEALLCRMDALHEGMGVGSRRRAVGCEYGLLVF